MKEEKENDNWNVRWAGVSKMKEKAKEGL